MCWRMEKTFAGQSDNKCFSLRQKLKQLQKNISEQNVWFPIFCEKDSKICCNLVISEYFSQRINKLQNALLFLTINLGIIEPISLLHKIKTFMSFSHLCLVIESRYPQNAFQLGVPIKTQNFELKENLDRWIADLFCRRHLHRIDMRDLWRSHPLFGFLSIFSKVWLLLNCNWRTQAASLVFSRFQVWLFVGFYWNFSKNVQLSKVPEFSIWLK